MPLQFVLSQRGKLQLLNEGFVYTKLRECREKIVWRCVQYHTDVKCTALAETTSQRKSGTILQVGEHIGHGPNATEVTVKKSISKMKKQARKTAEPTNTIVNRTLNEASTSTAAELPNAAMLTRTVQRERAKSRPTLPIPASRGDIELPEIYTTVNGQPFLYYDNEGDNKRFLIFATTKNMERLAECKFWFCDGTFSSVPVLFKQLYTIHGMVDGKVIPFVYVLAPSKSTRMYTLVLEALKSRNDSLNPEVIVTDFELSFLVAAQKIFPQAIIRGCHFHFGQCVYRHIQSSGQQTRYGSDDEFALHLKMLIALAFVPAEHVETAFNNLVATDYYKDNEDDLQEIISYFERTWIGEKKRSRRTTPIFNIDMWNCYTAVINDEPRTNNAVEGWHNGFNRRVRVAHASLWRFIDALKEEQGTTDATWEQHIAGREIAPPKRKKYRDYDRRLKNLVTNFDADSDVNEYLRGVAHNIRV